MPMTTARRFPGARDRLPSLDPAIVVVQLAAAIHGGKGPARADLERELHPFAPVARFGRLTVRVNRAHDQAVEIGKLGAPLGPARDGFPLLGASEDVVATFSCDHGETPRAGVTAEFPPVADGPLGPRDDLVALRPQLGEGGGGARKPDDDGAEDRKAPSPRQ